MRAAVLSPDDSNADMFGYLRVDAGWLTYFNDDSVDGNSVSESGYSIRDVIGGRPKP